MRSYTKIFALFVTVFTLTNCSTPRLTLQNETHTYKVDNSIAEDTAIINYYLPFKQQLENEMNRVIGYAESSLKRNPSQPESTAGTFFAEALLEIGKSIDPTAQIALATKFGIRADIKQGNVTVGNIFELMPFENAITILELSGNDLQTLANFIAKTNGQPLAGMTMEIEDNKPKSIFIQNEPFDNNKTYKLVTYDYLANGGDYIEGLDDPIKRNDSGIIVRKGLIEYVEQLTKEGKTINTKLDGRVKIIK
jgi:2',3'-cyclic-nucleotide 2'-phosphodiesterase (5'-nucleotidase family)